MTINNSSVTKGTITKGTIQLHIPATGQTATIESVAGSLLQLGFSPSNASFERSGNNLVITLDNGGIMVLDGFFAVGESTLPSFVTPDGAVVGGAELLASLYPDMDLTTASGSSPQNTSGNLGEYTDDAGNLVSGVQGLGMLGREGYAAGFGPGLETPANILLNAAGNNAAQTGPAGISNADPLPGPTPAPFHARGVLYVGGASPTDNFSFGVLDGNQNLVPGGASAAVTLSPAGDHPEYYTFSYDPATGRVSYALTAAGKAALAALPLDENLYSNITVTVNGQAYIMQIVVNRDNKFDSAAQDAADAALDPSLNPASILWGEWHSDSNGFAAFARHDINASNGNDSMNFYNAVDQGIGFSGSLQSNAGNDTLAITGASGTDIGTDIGTGIGAGIAKGLDQNATVNAGNGNNQINITGIAEGNNEAFGFFIAGLESGSGDDKLSVRAQSEDNGATGTWNSRINVGNGNNTVEFIGESATSHAYGINFHTQVESGSGDDSLSFRGISSGGGDATGSRYNSVIDSGAGNDTLVFEARTVSGKAHAAHMSTITSGAGADSISITGASQTDLAYGAYASVIDSGVGDDTVSVWAESGSGVATGMGNNASVLARNGDDKITIDAISRTNMSFGLNDSSSVDGGNGNDTVTINAEAWANAHGVHKSGIDGGRGDDSITITALSQNALAYGALNSTIDGGAGNDFIRVLVEGKGNAHGAHLSTIKSGEGDDSVSISATSNTGAAYGLLNSGFDAGSGNDNIYIEAISKTGMSFGVQGATAFDGGKGKDTISINAEAESNAHGVYLSTINAGNDDDSLTISATSNTGTALGVLNSTVDGGEGNDSISVEALSQNGMSFGLNSASAVLGGAGDDTISINAEARLNAHGIHLSTVNSGEGDDNVSINASSSNGLAYGVLSSTLVTEDGNDYVSVTANADNSAAYALHSSTLNLGDGNDTLYLAASGNANSRAIFRSMVDLGAGDDHLYLDGAIENATLNGGGGVDALHLGNSIITLSELLDSSNTISGFEALDLAGPGSKLVVNANVTGFTDIKGLEAEKLGSDTTSQGFADEHILRITGDNQDSVQLDSSWSNTPGNTITYDGTVYQQWISHDNTQMLLIQQEIMVIFG